MNIDHKRACQMATGFGRKMAVAFNKGETYIGWITNDDPALMAQQLMLQHAHAPSSRAHHAGKKAAMAVLYMAMGLKDWAREATEDFEVLCADEAEAQERLRRYASGVAEGRTNELPTQEAAGGATPPGGSKGVSERMKMQTKDSKRLRINQTIVRRLVDAYTHARLDNCAAPTEVQESMLLYLKTWVLSPLELALEEIGVPIPAEVIPYRVRSRKTPENK